MADDRLKQVLHMKEGTDETSYAKTSYIQKQVLLLTKSIKEEALRDIYCKERPATLCIADLGCSSNALNTLSIAAELVEMVENARRERLEHDPQEYQIYLNDLPGNDFNTLFRSLGSSEDSLKQHMGDEFGHCFVNGVPGSFYGRLFPANSLHFVHSSYSLHWLSQGLIDKEKIYTFNIPSYPPSPSEFVSLVETEGSFDLNQVYVNEVSWRERDQKNDNTSNTIDTYDFAKCMRSVWEPFLVSHFGEAIIEEVFKRYCEVVQSSMAKEDAFTNITVSLTKKQSLGQLSNSYGLESGGWLSAFILVGLGVICAYTACLLGKCLEKNPHVKNYNDIGQHAFGKKGKFITAAFIYVDIFMCLVSYTISLHDNLNMVFPGSSIKVPLIDKTKSLTVMAVLAALPTLWLWNLSSIAFLSSGNIMSLLIFVMLASTAISGAIKTNHSIPVLQLSKIPEVSGLFVFCYAGHVVFPDIYKAMRDPSKYTKAAIVSFTKIISFYTSVAFMGAKMFGPSISSQFTLNMPPHLVFTKVAMVATVLTPLTKYALQFAPFAIQLEHKFKPYMKAKPRMIAMQGPA